MKTEIKEILNYMEGGEDMLRWREQMKNLDTQDAAALQGMVDNLHALVGTPDQEHRGYYHLFLGCACHEQEDYKQATTQLKRALRELGESKNNQAVVHWLLSLNYSSLKEYIKARRELIKAEKLSKARILAMQERINVKIRNMFDDPIFAEVPPDPVKRIIKSPSALVLEE